MRAFIAIKLAPEIQDTLRLLQEELRGSSAGVTWVAPGNLHLTLKFLGEIDEATLGKAVSIVEECAAASPAFTLSVAGCGAFPNTRRPRVIWAGVTIGSNEMKRLANTLEDKLQKIGIPKEDRAFSSHITLGRVRSPGYDPGRASCLEQKKDYLTSAPLAMRVTTVTLFKSTLAPTGPVYEALKEASLITA